nr:hypothetical protein [Oenococcus oeni]
MAKHIYKRRGAERTILKELKTLGGSASRDDIKQAIADDNDSEFSYEDFF